MKGSLSKNIFLFSFSLFLLVMSFSGIKAADCWCDGSKLICQTASDPCTTYDYIEGLEIACEVCEANPDTWDYCNDLEGNQYQCCNYGVEVNCSCGCSSGACNSTCTPSTGSCSAGTYYSYAPANKYVCGSRTVRDGCCANTTQSCYCDCGTGNCSPNATCPDGTTSTVNVDPHSEQSDRCKDDPVCPYEYDYIDCYCTPICTPPTCASENYKTVEQFSPGGISQGTKELSCRNGSSLTPDRTTLCDLNSNTCYCEYCGKECPILLTNTGNANLILEDFRECTNDCSVSPIEADKHCYEPFSSQPTESLAILNDLDSANAYGFKSNSYTGIPDIRNINNAGNLNDPLRMEATYTDSTGAGDIEALFVWFRNVQLTGTNTTPIWISDVTTIPGQAPGLGSWGFMMRKNNLGEWNPYIPAWGEDPDVWKRVGSADVNSVTGEFYIKGPEKGNMVAVKINSIARFGLTNIEMLFDLRFSGNDISEPPAEIKYNILLMGLDKFSFTPYDNYNINYSEYWTSKFARYDDDDLSYYWPENRLRYKSTQNQLYARDWTDTGRDWTIDKKAPAISTEITTDYKNGTIVVSWEASDPYNLFSDLYSIVGDIMYSGEPKTEIKIAGSLGVVIPYPTTLPQPITSTIGDLPNATASNVSFYVPSDLNVSTHSGSVSIDPRANRDGTLYIYIRVYDDAGNMVLNNTNNSYNLDDWMVTDGGLAYSADETKSVAKVPNTSWNNQDDSIEGYPPLKGWVLPPLQFGPEESLLSGWADLSSEMWSEGFDLEDKKIEETRAYNLNGHIGHEKNNYYNELLDAYSKNRNIIPNLVEVENISGILASNLNPYCGNKKNIHCFIKSNRSLTVSQGFTCSGKGVIFVDGNLVINPNIINANKQQNLEACIFVVSGNVTIKEGKNSSPSGKFAYDQINGYILANGSVTIEHEVSKNDTDTYDGLYINGGIHSLGGFNPVERYLQFIDRLQYPVLAIDYHPKYGILAETFFGKEINLQTTEVGFK